MTEPALSIIKSDQPEKWQQILADLITDPKELVALLKLDERQSPASLRAMGEFPLKVPRPFAARMVPGDWNDPLLRQVWPAAAEETDAPGFVRDPLGESLANPVPGLLHKYQGRVLLTAAPHCAVHCRYCFRRHFDYRANTPGRTEFGKVLDYIRADASIEEAILSGGDPLALPDRQLDWLIGQLDAIPHLTTLRIHSRLPLVIPQRVSPELLEVLSNRRARLVLVLHCNHGRELTPEMPSIFGMLAANGVILLNQSVILRGVNDSSSILVELSKALFASGVLPYYLHLPDRVAGTSHFAVGEARARELLRDMASQLPGYLVPRLVQEQAGQPAKVRLA